MDVLVPRIIEDDVELVCALPQEHVQNLVVEQIGGPLCPRSGSLSWKVSSLYHRSACKIVHGNSS